VAGPQSPSLKDRLLRLLLTGAHDVMKLGWFVRRPRTYGAHALAFTPERRIILVKLRYARGWRLPGGGRKKGEEPRDAVLRELGEEIGMTSHGRVRLACDLEQENNFRRDLASLLVVDDVRYRPRRSWEIEAIREVTLDDLPADMSPIAVEWIDALRRHL
jgi:8-oxo-dGTP pyrophosphatase MutT (NUDIX family)